jgi:hypothetical protein
MSFMSLVFPGLVLLAVAYIFWYVERLHEPEKVQNEDEEGGYEADDAYFESLNRAFDEGKVYWCCLPGPTAGEGNPEGNPGLAEVNRTSSLETE